MFILVKFSGRGLVFNGYPNLKLFNKLFWLFFITIVTYSYVVFPLAHQLKGEFPKNSTKGQICLRLDFRNEEMNL